MPTARNRSEQHIVSECVKHPNRKRRNENKSREDTKSFASIEFRVHRDVRFLSKKPDLEHHISMFQSLNVQN
ncbi:hypothetical protein ACTXT7_012391 [Hymenolepis weldensis]